MIVKNWWKILAVLLMLYALVAGILVPLKPGIRNFHPRKITLGPNANSTLAINTYNTQFTKAKESKVWLKLPSDKLIEANKLDILSDNQLAAHFDVNNTLSDFEEKKDGLTLIVYNNLDGRTIYPNAVRVNYNKEIGSGANVYSGLDVVGSVDNFRIPYNPQLQETIRNTYFHVAIWFAMFLLLIYSCFQSIKYLRNKNLEADMLSSSLTSVAIVFGIAGILTGSMWAKYTWGAFWTTDIKLNMSATALLVYFAYWILRSSIKDIDTRARLSAVYNLFAFVCLMILVMVIPRMTDSLHPGNGGNPALGGEDMDNVMRTVFYPAIIGYTLIGYWMAQLLYRYTSLKDRIDMA